jgi:transcriptional regulator with XRE-family HTH domain
MGTTSWKNLNHKVGPERRAELKREAVAEYDRLGFAAVRKARKQTQVELAQKLGIKQAQVSAIENRSDLLMSTLTKYIRALGGDVEIRAVFPEASFSLAPPALAVADAKSPATKRKATSLRKAAPARRLRAAS